MDQIDRLLLRELQADADRSLDDLGAIVGLSASAVQRRMRRLKADGTIARVVAELDPARLGVAVTIVTMVRFERDGNEHTRGLIDKLRSRPEVQMLHVLTGPHDLLIVTVVGDLADYSAGVLSDIESDDNVFRLETNVSLASIKSTRALPVGI